ncbi:MAG: hypothetical protein H6545_00065 [Bacteroidales bacterium]|nr:hypothetical protein [Bacteroidales bacterium]
MLPQHLSYSENHIACYIIIVIIRLGMGTGQWCHLQAGACLCAEGCSGAAGWIGGSVFGGFAILRDGSQQLADTV